MHFSKSGLLHIFSIAFATLLSATPMTQADVVRFNTNIGSFDVDLFEVATAQTVTNFMHYLDNGDYTQSIVHRSSPGFVIQGGGFYTDGAPVTTIAPVTNEPGISNLRGTIAMAKIGGDPNSATSQWFFNLNDNTFLDSDNGGFTVFGQVLGDGMDIVDQIASLDIVDANGGNPFGPFGELPILDSSLLTLQDNLVVIHSIVVVPEPTGLSLLLISGALLVCRRNRQAI